MTTAPSETASAAAGVRLDVRFAGGIGCATFPYGCRATLSVLEPSADIADTWRPPSTDPWWAPDDGDGMTAETFDPKPFGGSPTATPGRHRLVVSLLGSHDTPSYDPEGKPAFDLLGRCTADTEVRPDAGVIGVLVTFTPDEAGFGASCTIVVGST